MTDFKPVPLARGAAVFLSLLSLTALTSCRDSDYLYYVETEKKVWIEASRSIKDLEPTDVDILWVIDNSGSMGTYQQKVIQNTSFFMQEFTKKASLRWRMGLISTDTDDLPYVGLSPLNRLDYTSPDPIPVFQAAVAQLGTSGDGYEKSFQPIMQHLSAYPDFQRTTAVLAIIFVTDAYEQSSVTTQEFADWLATVRGTLKNVLSYGAFAASDLPCYPGPGESGWNYTGSKYEEFLSLTHGSYFPICHDFGKNLAEVAKDIVRRAERPMIFLDVRPDRQTIEVYYEGKLLPGGPPEDGGFWVYDYERNALVFHDLSFAPGDQEKVTVRFLPAPVRLEE